MKKRTALTTTESPNTGAVKGTERKPLLESAVAAAKAILKPRAKKKAAAPETEVDATTVVRRTYTRKKKEADTPEVPAILLEGDAPTPAPASGPGEKYSLGATPPAQI